MLVFDMIVDERRRMADLLEDLTADQMAQPSLCDAWTVHEVAAHLITYLRFGQLKIYLGMLATAGDFGPANEAMAQWDARRSSSEIIGALRRGARSRTTVPRSGYAPVLTDILLHDLDIRLPLGIARTMPEDRLRVAFDHLATVPALGFNVGSRLHGLRLEASDAGWASGSGALVSGPAEALLLGISGRTVAFGELDGDGVPLLRDRITRPPRTGPAQRMGRMLRVLVRPSRIPEDR
jgi:uncharacterized protein (TIGR03083 family)